MTLQLSKSSYDVKIGQVNRLVQGQVQLLNQCSIIIMIKHTQAINYINFISKISPNNQVKSPSPSAAFTSKNSIQCLTSLQKRLEIINRSQAQQVNRKQNCQLQRQQHKKDTLQANQALSHKQPANFITNIRRSIYEVYRQTLIKKKQFLKKMIADEETMLWKSSLTESQEQNRPKQQKISCNNSFVNSKTRKQSLSGLSFIKKKYTFNNHLLVPMIDNQSFSRLKLERIHKTPLKDSRRNQQASSKIKEAIRERRLDYKPLFKVKQIQRERLPTLGVDAKRIKLPAACKQEQKKLRQRRIKTEACAVAVTKALFNSTTKFIGWQTQSSEEIGGLMERQ